jgi:hypothetical protein
MVLNDMPPCSIERVITADESTLIEVRGVGPKKAARNSVNRATRREVRLKPDTTYRGRTPRTEVSVGFALQ